MQTETTIDELIDKYPEAETYLLQASRAIMQAALVCDYAKSTEKMLSWECVGTENEAWKIGPYIASPKNEPPINRDTPYIIRPSIETRKLAGITVRNQSEIKGMVKLELPDGISPENRSEFIVSRMAIIEQFEIFKSFISSFDGPVNKKRAKSWANKEENWIIEVLVDSIERRNELTHENNFKSPNMKEAINYFYGLIHVAPLLQRTAKMTKQIKQ